MGGCLLDNSEPLNTGSACAGVPSHPRRRLSWSQLMVGKLEPRCCLFLQVLFHLDTADPFFHLLSVAAFTHSRGGSLQSVNDPPSPIYFLYDPSQRVYWPLVHTDQWPNWSPAHLIRVCGFSISVPWCWGFLLSHHHVWKTGCKTILNTNPRLWVLSVASCVSLKMVFPSPRNTYSSGRLKVLSDL